MVKPLSPKLKTSQTTWLVRLKSAGKKSVSLHRLGLPSPRLFSSLAEVRGALAQQRPAVIFVEAFPSRKLVAELKRLQQASPASHLVLLTCCDDLPALNAEITNLVLEEASFQVGPATVGPDIYGLSIREKEILRLMAKGLINKEIAEEFSISYFTVENHQRKIYEKLKVHTRTAAVTKVLLEKLV